MPLVYKMIRHPGCQTHHLHGLRGVYYRLDDGREIKLHDVLAWCPRCHDVTWGEHLDTLKHIDEQIAKLERLAAEYWRDIARPPLPTPDAPGDRHQREQIAELQVRRAWRSQRRSPPRCLTCASTGIMPVEYQKPVAVRGGSVVIDAIGFASSTGLHMMWYFTPEGIRIPDAPPVAG